MSPLEGLHRAVPDARPRVGCLVLPVVLELEVPPETSPACARAPHRHLLLMGLEERLLPERVDGAPGAGALQGPDAGRY